MTEENANTRTAPQYITQEDVAQLLGISLRTVQTLTRTGSISKYCLGRSVRFLEAEVIEDIKALRVAAKLPQTAALCPECQARASAKK